MMTFDNPVYWVLIALAAVAVVVFFERFFELRRAQIDWQDFTKGVFNVLDGGNENEALSICEDTPVPVASIMACAIRRRTAPVHILREAVDAQGRAIVNRLYRRLTTLALIGRIAPLVGLLGTILGFVRALTLLNGAELVARVDVLHAAVPAFFSAALGLAVMIPVIIMHACLKLRVDRIVFNLEAAATSIVGYFAAKAGQAKGPVE